MFVVETLTDVPIYKAFGSSMAAQRWAENDAHLEHDAQQCQIYRTISGLNSMQAIAAVKVGKAERLLTVRRRGTDGAGSPIGPSGLRSQRSSQKSQATRS
jgi:hypothetical protein